LSALAEVLVFASLLATLAQFILGVCTFVYFHFQSWFSYGCIESVCMYVVLVCLAAGPRWFLIKSSMSKGRVCMLN